MLPDHDTSTRTIPEKPVESKFKVTHCGHQTDIGYKQMNHFQCLLEEEKKLKVWPRTPVCNFLLANEEKARKWTGLDEYDRTLIWNHLGDAKYKLKMLNLPFTSGDMRSLSVPCQYLLTLSILRKGFDYGEYSDIYGVSTTTVTKVFKTWIYFMYSVFSHPEWKRTLHVRTKDLPPPPKVFDNQWLRKIRFVIDTTSFEVSTLHQLKPGQQNPEMIL